MEQLIHAFGIDVRLIIIQAVNFGLLMVALTYFLYQPILKLLRDREEKIATGIKDAEAAAVAKADAETQKRAVLVAANQEAEAVAARAKVHADQKAETIIAEANRKAEQAAREAALRAEEMKAQAVKESEAEIAKLAILAAEKVLASKSA